MAETRHMLKTSYDGVYVVLAIFMALINIYTNGNSKKVETKLMLTTLARHEGTTFRLTSTFHVAGGICFFEVISCTRPRQREKYIGKTLLTIIFKMVRNATPAMSTVSTTTLVWYSFPTQNISKTKRSTSQNQSSSVTPITTSYRQGKERTKPTILPYHPEQQQFDTLDTYIPSLW